MSSIHRQQKVERQDSVSSLDEDCEFIESEECTGVRSVLHPAEPFSRAHVASFTTLVDKDVDTGLDLFCYSKCDKNSSAIVQQYRGLVFHGNDLVVKNFPYNPEYGTNDLEEISSIIQDNFSKCRFCDAYEGTCLRMFYYGDKWYLASNRKLDAYRSRWGSRKSFGEIFQDSLFQLRTQDPEKYSYLPDTNSEELVTAFQKCLDKTRQYMFFLTTTNENRIVCKGSDVPFLFHVGTFYNGELLLDEDLGIPRPNSHSFQNIDELISHVQNVEPMYTPGIIVFLPGNKQIKVYNEGYRYFSSVRGNEASIKFRYLQVRMDNFLGKDICSLYPEYQAVFDEYENLIYRAAKNIYDAYINRFIKKIYTVVSKDEYQVLKRCHEWHVADRTSNKIHLDKVISIVNSLNPTIVNHMIRHLKLEASQTPVPPPSSPSDQENSV